jgi:CheY-like chemotaxis protein
MNMQSISGKTRKTSTPSDNSLRILRSPRVLVADDDPHTSSCLSDLASEQGFKIVPVRDGGEAYRLFQTDADFRVAIINMTMPGIRGLDILRHMKTENRLKRIPVIIVTGDDGLQVISESFAAGAIALIPKPLKAEQLWLMVRMVSDLPRQKRRAA